MCLTARDINTNREEKAIMIPQAWKENKPKIMRRGCFFLVVLVFGILQISDVLPTFFGKVSAAVAVDCSARYV